MREFTFASTSTEHMTTTFHISGQTVSFVNGVCKLDNPSPIQLALLDEKIKQKLVIETTPDKKKTKPSKRAAKKKRG